MKNNAVLQNNIHVPQGFSSSTIKIYFWLGIMSALALRLILIADHYNPILGKAMFYLGVVGYMIFFAHRYRVSKRRLAVLEELKLLEKLESGKQLTEFTEKDIEGLHYIIWSLSVSKERINYLLIFTFSVLSIFISLILDLGITG
ncbi:hypothetical protein [uncultured Methanomethylovorans sp.]|uniref:hypothetical protein n=1 Tax=uncultured Methanomethylovorans sp. TaxID=183759 RepID=UPI002AA647D2|nr:hypothetical protein [uncultured Methanomethylovorans sp.]